MRPYAVYVRVKLHGDPCEIRSGAPIRLYLHLRSYVRPNTS